MARRLSSSAFISILTSNGFTFISKRGSHAKYRDDNSHTVIVPHSRKDIPIGTLRSMIRQS
ncbi:type II toxin-antitoxin system HicA family toxin [Akkermansiaceae bacterium]|nr:type II toxin-antitoxin system HicA family toxin [Akkermansiaceae bacterium]